MVTWHLLSCSVSKALSSPNLPVPASRGWAVPSGRALRGGALRCPLPRPRLPCLGFGPEQAVNMIELTENNLKIRAAQMQNYGENFRQEYEIEICFVPQRQQFSCNFSNVFLPSRHAEEGAASSHANHRRATGSGPALETTNGRRRPRASELVCCAPRCLERAFRL